MNVVQQKGKEYKAKPNDKLITAKDVFLHQMHINQNHVRETDNNQVIEVKEFISSLAFSSSVSLSSLIDISSISSNTFVSGLFLDRRFSLGEVSGACIGIGIGTGTGTGGVGGKLVGSEFGGPLVGSGFGMDGGNGV